MILLTVGTEKFSFHRLVEAFDRLAAGPLSGAECFAQIGSSSVEPKHAGFDRLVPFDRMRELIAGAELVITHAGAGSSLLCLELGQRPIAVPRLHAHGEHVDDHQRLFAERLAGEGLIDCVTDLDQLGNRITERLAAGSTGRAVTRDTGLAQTLNGVLEGYERQGGSL